jgi:hypothetical protein
MTEIDRLIRAALGEEAVAFEYHAGERNRMGWRRAFPMERRELRSGAWGVVERSWRRFHEKDVRFLVGPRQFETGPGEYADSWGDAEADPEGRTRLIEWAMALPGLPLADVAEVCRTGSHKESDESLEEALASVRRFAKCFKRTPAQMRVMEARVRRKFTADGQRIPRWQRVRDGLRDVEKICPFEVQFADEGGLHATLLKPVDDEQAGDITAILLDLEIELETSEEELRRLGIAVPKDEEGFVDQEAAMRALMVSGGKFRLWWD